MRCHGFGDPFVTNVVDCLPKRLLLRLLALTFAEPDDYDRIREADRLSLVGLADLAPGRPVDCVIAHADGSRERIALRHSYSASQLDWFRAGSALNSVRRAA